jgi:hypothetical protein
LVRGLAVSQLDDFVLMLAMQLAQFQGSARGFGRVPTTTTKDQAKQNKQTEKAKAKATKDASKAQGVRKRPRVRMRPMPWPTETEHRSIRQVPAFSRVGKSIPSGTIVGQLAAKSHKSTKRDATRK